MIKKITDSIYYIGVDDKTIDLFESQYRVPDGVSYNSYLIDDDKIVVMDAVDRRATDAWLQNLEEALHGRTPDYLVISHMEPDHAGSLKIAAEKYPGMKLVGTAKAFAFFGQFFDIDIDARKVAVKEGDSLELGSHTLNFVTAPMVHWPEVMVTYESSEKILFSADGFGKFGSLDTDEEWADEARRYYINIVGKYGSQVQSLLKKAAKLDIAMICPLHGPVLSENLGYYIGLYDTWSSYRPEEEGVVVAYASIHGNTAAAAEKMGGILRGMTDIPVKVYDLSRTDLSFAVSEVFRYSKAVFMSASYDAGLFPCMEDFLHHLKAKTWRNRKVAVIENGTWAPSAGKVMRAILGEMKGITICENTLTIKSALKTSDEEALEEIARELLAD